MADLTKLSFFSEVNYLKRDDEISGTQQVAFTGTNNEILTVTINHNLGYIPFHTVACNVNDDDIIWSSNRAEANVAQSASRDEATFYYWCTDTTLTINLKNKSSSAYSGTRDVYWAIYLDYSA